MIGCLVDIFSTISVYVELYWPQFTFCQWKQPNVVNPKPWNFEKKNPGWVWVVKKVRVGSGSVYSSMPVNDSIDKGDLLPGQDTRTTSWPPVTNYLTCHGVIKISDMRTFRSNNFQTTLCNSRVAEVARKHKGPSPKILSPNIHSFGVIIWSVIIRTLL